MNTRNLYQPSPESTCAKVMNFARQRNSRELMRLLRDGYALNERSLGRDAVSYLAEAGDFGAAQYLIDRYQSFSGSINSLMFGAAIGGHDQVVERIFDRDDGMRDTDTRSFLRCRLAWNYALGGHVSLVNQMLKKIDGKVNRYGRIHKLLYYYALNGSCQDEIDSWYQRIDYLAKAIKVDRELIRHNFEVATKRAYAQRGLLEDELTLLHAAKGGNETYVYDFLAAERASMAEKTTYIKKSKKRLTKKHRNYLFLIHDRIANYYPFIAKKALFHSPSFAFNVMKKTGFSNMKSDIEKMIEYGLFTWRRIHCRCCEKNFGFTRRVGSSGLNLSWGSV